MVNPIFPDQYFCSADDRVEVLIKDGVVHVALNLETAPSGVVSKCLTLRMENGHVALSDARGALPTPEIRAI